MIHTVRFFFDGVKDFTEIEITAWSGTEAMNVARAMAKAASASHFNVSIGEIN